MAAEIKYQYVGYHHGGPLEQLTGTIDPSKLGADDILVKVSAAALNPVDFILHNSHRFASFFSRGDKGFGRDFSGTVEGLGSGVTKFEKGDVISGILEPIFGCYGSLSEYVVIDTKVNRNIGTIPKNLTVEQAAAFPLTLSTAYKALSYYKKPAECESVLVVGGATAVGSFVVQLLKKVYKVRNVVSVNSSTSSERVSKYGADIIVDYKKEDVKTQVLALVKDIGKFDLIIDCVGNTYFFDCMTDVLKPKAENSGYVTINGSTVGDYTASALQYISWANVKLVLFPKQYNFAWGATANDFYENAKGLFEEGLLEVPIDTVFPFADYKKAIAKLIDHKAQGKVVISFE